MKQKINSIFNCVKDQNFLHLCIFIFPFLDVLISVSIKNNFILGEFSLIFRALFIFFILYYIFFKVKSKFKKYVVNYLYILLCYFVFFLTITLFTDGFVDLVIELKSLIKFAYYPFMISSFVLIFDEKKDNLRSYFYKIFDALIYIYTFLLFIPFLTNSAYQTYDYNKYGYSGWFFSGNEISVIISLLTPFVIIKGVSVKNFKSMIVPLLFVFCSLNIGTKTPLIAFIISLIVIYTYKIINIIRDKRKIDFKNSKYFLIFNICLCFMLMYNPNYNNIENQSYNFELNYDSTSDSNDQLNENVVVDELHEYTSFPENRVYSEVTVYQTSKIMNLLLSSRDQYFMVVFNEWKDVSLVEKTFGIGTIYTTAEGLKFSPLIEMDFFDILVYYGFIGFLIIVVIPLIVLFLAFINILKSIFINKNDLIMTSSLSIAIGYLISFSAGHILGAPAANLYLAILMAYVIVDNYNIKNKKNLNKDITIFETKFGIDKNNLYKYILVIPLVILISVFFSTFIKNEAVIFSVKYEDGSLSSSNCLLKLEEIESVMDFDIQDELYYYSCSTDEVLFDLVHVRRTFANGFANDYFTISNLTDSSISINLETDFTLYSNVFDFSEYEIKNDFSSVVGFDELTLPALYTYNKSSLLVGKSYIYKTINTMYDEFNYSTYKDLSYEVNDVYYNNDFINKKIVLKPSEKVDTYFFNGNDLLLEETEIIDYIDLLNNNIISSWETYDGSYWKIPYSIEPFSENGYGRNIGAIIIKEIVGSDTLLYSNLIDNTLITYFNYLPRHIDGVWYTEFTSTWLKYDYGITSLFVDTRHNENISRYFKLISNIDNNQQLFDASFLYADYLVSVSNDNKTVEYGDYYLIADYFSNNHIDNTHSSLNHQLAIANYLLESYLDSSNKSYYNLAMNLISAIEYSYSDWIRDNGDLWYQVNKSGEYMGTDYEFVTLDDLVYTQDLLKKIRNMSSKELSILINSKIEYLTESGHDMSGY